MPAKDGGKMPGKSEGSDVKNQGKIPEKGEGYDVKPCDVEDAKNEGKMNGKGESVNHCDGDELDISSLGDTEVFIRFPLSKKLLAEKSPVFRRQFSGPMRDKTNSKEPLTIDIGNFSLESCAAFFCYMSGVAKYLVQEANDCSLILEVFLLADKYQVDENTKVLEEVVDKLSVTEENLFAVADAALKHQDIPPLTDICRKILRKCVEAVHSKQMDLLKLWSDEYGNDGHALRYLTEELNSYREKSKEKVCENCGFNPCLNGEKMKKFMVWPHMKLSRSLTEFITVREILDEPSTDHKHMSADLGHRKVYFNVDTVSGASNPNWSLEGVWTYQCKEKLPTSQARRKGVMKRT